MKYNATRFLPMRPLLSLFLLSASVQQVSAQDIDTALLNRYFDTLAAHDKFMGSATISKGGTILYNRSVGYADVQARVPLHQRPEMRIGSISKMFTAVMIMKAVEEQKLQLDTKLSAYFPKVKHAELITIEQLLRHRSGIHNFTDDAAYRDWYTQAQSKDDMVSRIEGLESDFKPDSRAQYSNANYVLLGYILEKIYKKPYEVLVQQMIVQPLGLKHTYYGGRIDTAKGEAYSYHYTKDWELEPETDMSVPGGAGALVSVPADLVRFAEALYGGKLLQPKTVAQMQNLKDHYGMGMFVMPFYDKKAYGHNGGIDGFSSALGYFPEDKLGFSMISNGSNYNTNQIAIAILSAAYQKPFEIPVFDKAPYSPVNLNAYPGVYSAAGMPIQITVMLKDGVLTAQATGQGAFPLEPTGKDQFSFEQAGIVIEFDVEKQSLTLNQGGGSFTFTKNKE